MSKPVSDSNPRPISTKQMTEQPVSLSAGKPSIVRIVGTGDGIVMRIGDRGGLWNEIVRVLSAHLAKAEGFFQGERIAIEIGERHLIADDMQQIADVLAGYNITIWAVRTSNPETHRMVQEIGLAAEWLAGVEGNNTESLPGNERARWEVHLGQKGLPTPSAKPIAEFQPPQTIADSIAVRAIDPEDIESEDVDLDNVDLENVEDELAAPAPVEHRRMGTVSDMETVPSAEMEEGSEEETDPEVILAPPYIYSGTLRSGQVFRHAGTVMVVGDVNPGAEVISGGDIFVWGKLRGIVHAGAMGNERSIVCAIDFEPIQLRIAGHIAMSPKAISNEPGRWFWRRDAVEKPEVARVLGKQIIVDVWDRQ